MTFLLVKLLLAHKSYETNTYKIFERIQTILLLRVFISCTQLLYTYIYKTRKVYIYQRNTYFSTQHVFQYTNTLYLKCTEKCFVNIQIAISLTEPIPVYASYNRTEPNQSHTSLAQSTFRAKSVNSSNADKSSSNLKYIIPKSYCKQNIIIFPSNPTFHFIREYSTPIHSMCVRDEEQFMHIHLLGIND